MRECEWKKREREGKKMSVRIEKGRKGGKNRVGTGRLEIRKSAIEVGIYCSEKAKSWNSEQLGQCMFTKLCYFLNYNVFFSKQCMFTV